MHALITEMDSLLLAARLGPEHRGPLRLRACPSDPRHRKEFLLGDVPAITIDHAGAYGIWHGVTVDDAEKIVMPLTSRLLVAIGPPDGACAIADDEVDACNEMQVREARVRGIRHGANFAADIPAWRVSAT